MSFLKLIIFVICLHAFSAFSATYNCEPATTSGGYNYDQWSAVHVPFELKSSGLTMTLGDNIADWSVIYTVYADIGMQTASCTSDYWLQGISMYYTLFSQAPLVGTQGKDYIYSTDVPGIGVSVTANEKAAGVKSYPSVVYYGAPTVGFGFWANIKFWKIPGNIPMNNGPVTVTGPEAAVVLMSDGSNFTSSESSRITSDGMGYISSSRILTLTMMFQPGTCNVDGDNVKVNMGEYDGADGHSGWKDASFKLTCPNGMGYGGGVSTNKSSSHDGYDFPYSLPTDSTITANNMKNGRVQISIVPYTEVVDANKGIIALDGTGAQGYGIQLAWGDYSSQNEIEPANPVVLNSYVSANSLNSGFGAGDTPIGGNAFNGTDNTIKMAARYVRTTGETAPGPANAVVQVIANYE
ncbi:hypothetical protein [Enterobacter soli]|uniref:fimbrial protein n=1 Tax=Enterobacter soli TaxID=885040 RepID=UPI002F3FFD2B